MNIDQKLVNSLHGLLNCEISGLDCCVITPETIITSCKTLLNVYTLYSPFILLLHQVSVASVKV